MIETVARALWADRYPDKEWDKLDEIVRTSYEGHARAAIEAMREPTDAMLVGGDNATWDPDGHGDNQYVGETVVRRAWIAMVDAALTS